MGAGIGGVLELEDEYAYYYTLVLGVCLGQYPFWSTFSPEFSPCILCGTPTTRSCRVSAWTVNRKTKTQAWPQRIYLL